MVSLSNFLQGDSGKFYDKPFKMAMVLAKVTFYFWRVAKGKNLIVDNLMKRKKSMLNCMYNERELITFTYIMLLQGNCGH